MTDSTVELAYVDQGYTGENAAEVAKRARHPARSDQISARKTRLRAPAQTMGRRTKLRMGRFTRLARDYERLNTTLKGFHSLAFAILMTAKLIQLATS